MNRRNFVLNTVKGGVALSVGGFPLNTFAENQPEFTKLTILHTNDVHSHIDPFPMDGTQNQGMGGVARRFNLIKKVRASEKNVMLLDAGDIFQGTPYFNMYNGELEIKLMEQMGYDATTIGNHDFDGGMENLVKQLKYASFPILNTNYGIANTPLQNHVQPYKIFVKDGIKVGVFGVGIELAGLVPDKLYGETRYNDPVKIANDTAMKLKGAEKCDYVICLSHLGYKFDNDPNKISDVKLAGVSKNIDLIIGGHTHTFLSKPDVTKNAEGKPIIINQVGWAGLMLGRIDLVFERGKNKNCQTCKNISVG